MVKVVKRDGRKVPFTRERIELAVSRAGLTDEQAKEFANSLKYSTRNLAVWEIQALVEKELIDQGYLEVAENYVNYRFQKDLERKRLADSVAQLQAKDKSVVNENANKDSRQFHTQRDLTAGAVAKAIGLSMMPPEVAEAHKNGTLHWHDADYAPYNPLSNCSLINFSDLFTNGFQLGNAEIEPPKSIQTATAQTSQIVAQVASSQYGGTSFNSIDEVLAPFAEMNYQKHLADAEKYQVPDPQKYAEDKTRKDVYDAMQALEYELNTLFTSQGQTPFTSLGFGLGTGKWEREIQKSILQVRIGGLGKDKRTAIFPKLIFAVKDGVNLKPEDPNYDIKQLALTCAAKRMYPDIVSYDKIVEITGDFKFPMGCVAGWETVQWDDKFRPIEDMWEEMAQRFEVKTQPNGKDLYIDLKGVRVLDSHTGKSESVECKRIIKNRSADWLQIKVSGGRVLTCTPDHPLPVVGRGRTPAGKLNIGDKLQLSTYSDAPEEQPAYGDKAWLMGLILCDGCLSEPTEVIVSYAYSGESEIRSRVSAWYGDESVRDWEHHRGKKGDYREFAIKDKSLVSKCVAEFGGDIKRSRSLPEKIFSATRSERVDFMAGMIDADGHINAKSQNVQIGSTNPAIAYGQLRLAETLGIEARMYLNKYKKSDPTKVRFRVEFPITDEIANALACEKKRDKVRFKRTNARPENGIVTSITHVDGLEFSYDVTTESDYFDVSGIVSHNCRSFLQGVPDGTIEGRMNLGVVTLNLPRIALESDDKEQFWKLLDKRIELMRTALEFKAHRVTEAKPENAPILYKNGAFWARLKDEDSVNELFKNKMATVSFGYIGLYETVAKFYGPDWENGPEAKEFSLDILRRIKAATDTWPEYHYSVYGTPSESLTDRFCRMDRELFGDIPNITNKEYYTNSFHYDVRKSPNPFEKIDFEAAYPPLAAGGFIHYVELPPMDKNLAALESIWDYACDRVGYFGTNTSIDSCFECGFKGEFSSTNKGYKCPECGNNDPDTADVTRRLCGYLGNPLARPAVHGRQVEISERVKHIG